VSDFRVGAGATELLERQRHRIDDYRFGFGSRSASQETHETSLTPNQAVASGAVAA
jgi:hypothetical protein